MKRIMIVGTILLGMAALAGVGAISVSAQSHEFTASTTGKTKSKGTDQVIDLSGGKIECSEVTGTGEAKETTSTTHKEVLTYSGCVGFGNTVTISAATFVFNADGSATLEKRITITPVGAECKLVVEPQTIEGLTYDATSGKLKSVVDGAKVAVKGGGGECGGNQEALYSGTIEAELEGGTLSWK
ncbi:MAG TPA: hypothetical protein VMD79_00705 [Solirubrobacteraceae bacterium]|nr:hypothetical protein [Solirubrobacteraceae bacterium]